MSMEMQLHTYIYTYVHTHFFCRLIIAMFSAVVIVAIVVTSYLFSSSITNFHHSDNEIVYTSTYVPRYIHSIYIHILVETSSRNFFMSIGTERHPIFQSCFRTQSIRKNILITRLQPFLLAWSPRLRSLSAASEIGWHCALFQDWQN